MKQKLYNNFKWIILLLCVIIFLILSINVINKNIMKIDIFGYDLIFKYWISDKMTLIVKIITNAGGTIFLSLVTIILFVFIKNKKIGFSIVANILIAIILNLVLKNILQRTRPVGINLIVETSFSFPSGHSMVSMAFYGYLIYLVNRYVKNDNFKLIITILLNLLILLIGLSRIYLGVHYISDVLAGFLFSIIYLIIYITIVSKKI